MATASKISGRYKYCYPLPQASVSSRKPLKSANNLYDFCMISSIIEAIQDLSNRPEIGYSRHPAESAKT